MIVNTVPALIMDKSELGVGSWELGVGSWELKVKRRTKH